MEIKRLPTDVSITFSPKSYWLRKNSKNSDWLGEYALTHRIDMSYKGKDDQEGSVVLYLDARQADAFKEAGFDELEGGVDPTNI